MSPLSNSLSPQIICLSPTFDLAKQTGNVLTQMAKFCPDLKMVYALRGERGELLVVCSAMVWIDVVL